MSAMANGFCSKCRTNPPVNGQRYCRPCRAAYMRANRPPYSKLSPEAKKKAACRSHTKMMIRRGQIERQPCWCGAKAEIHHNNYDDPSDIQWLCRKHHIGNEHKTAAALLGDLVEAHGADLRRAYVAKMESLGVKDYVLRGSPGDVVNVPMSSVEAQP